LAFVFTAGFTCASTSSAICNLYFFAVFIVSVSWAPFLLEGSSGPRTGLALSGRTPHLSLPQMGTWNSVMLMIAPSGQPAARDGL
jgi:hypothetical protein